MDHFGPGAELLDINSEGDVIKFLGYTEKAVDVNTACKLARIPFSWRLVLIISV